MKQLIALFTSILFIGFTANATATNHIETNSINSSSVRGYGNSFIFVEQNIEFSIFPDGQFDFYMPNYGPSINVSVNTPNASISFNSGYDYNAYVQYDEFGAIVQIEHVPVFYDYYGRVSQVGNVLINYNGFGYVHQVGGLYVHYNRYNRFSHCSGFINIHNRFYVFRPWHTYFRIPSFNHCVVFNRPYRQHYRPVRYQYTRPFVNNHRRTTAVASRRGNTITRRSELATRGNDRPRSTVNANSVGPRRGNATASPRTNTQSTPRPRVTTSNPRSSVSTKPRTTNNTVKPRVSTRPKTQSKPRVTSPSRTPSKSRVQKSASRSKVSHASRKTSSSNKRTASTSRKRR
ncbi:hypothetical protein ACFS5M_07335 [Lacinutrix iliipiscaria]|uniref:Sperm nuclear basic protein PL-I n=1 Tax=Lacinutrix iliipiscaria TaxID=1230532 RepID=A0ABW5WNK9_9FLAO